MNIVLNGTSHELAAPCHVAELVEQLQMSGRLAVEVNETIVPRSSWAEHRLAEGDRVEIVRAIGGGQYGYFLPCRLPGNHGV